MAGWRDISRAIFQGAGAGGEDGHNDSGEAQDFHSRKHKTREETKKHYEDVEKELENEKGDEPPQQRGQGWLRPT